MVTRLRLPLVILTVILPAAVAHRTLASACGMEAQRVVAHKTIEALPAPVRTALSAHFEAVLERAVEPGGAWRRNPRHKARDGWHYLMLDAAAADGTPDQRLRAGLAFPTNERDAIKLFREHGIKRGGSLPWRLQECVDHLAEAMESGDVDEMVKSAGYVIHFCADAANPFCATRNQRGEESGNIIFGLFDVGDPLFAHQDVAHRVGWELIRRNAHRYRESIDVATFRDLPATDVTYRALEVMVTSLEGMSALAQADAEILARLDVTDAEGFLARADEYYELLDERCGEHCVENLRRGASLAAALIAGAWERVGSPDPIVASPKESDTDPPRVAAGRQPPPPSQASSPPPPPPAPPAPIVVAVDYVASKHSKIYHRSDCKHAEKINPINVLHFATAEEAAASGKRPCRICSPETEGTTRHGMGERAAERH